MEDGALFTIGYEKARLADVVATLTTAGVATLIDVRDLPISQRPGFSKHQRAAAEQDWPPGGRRGPHAFALRGRWACRNGENSSGLAA
jgi:hypothetical protein